MSLDSPDPRHRARPWAILLAVVALAAARQEIRATDGPQPPVSRPERRAPVTLLLDCAVDGNCQAVAPDRDTRNPDVAGYRYAYAPSLVREGDALHLFYCSLGVLTDRSGTSPGGGDAIRYTTSNDGGTTWSRPIVVVKLTNHDGKVDHDACDPCTVFFDGAYYIFYTSSYINRLGLTQGAVQVARSDRIGGPYLTYTERGTWEDTPIDPRRILEPRRERAPSAMSTYGAGQTALVVKDGILNLWYVNDSDSDVLRDGRRSPREEVLFSQSRDAIHWSPPRVVSVNPAVASMDVKYDPGRNRFLMTWAQNHSRCARVLTSESRDGLRWDPPRTLMPPSATPRYANNLGVLGDRSGWFTDRTFVAVAANDDQAADEDCDPPAGTSALTRLKLAAPAGDQIFLTPSAEEAGRLEQEGWKRLNVPGCVFPAPDSAPDWSPSTASSSRSPAITCTRPRSARDTWNARGTATRGSSATCSPDTSPAASPCIGCITRGPASTITPPAASST